MGIRWSEDLFVGSTRHLMVCCESPETHPLRPCQEPSPCHIQIRQPAADLEPVGILGEPAVPNLGPPEDPLDHQERMFDFRTDPRLDAVAGALRLAQRPIAMGFGLDETFGIGSILLNDVALPAVGCIAPDPRLLPVQQLRQHLAVMHIGRRGGDRMNQRGAAVDANMRLHAEVPLVAFPGLVHLEIPLFRTILRRTRRIDDGGIHDGASAHRQALCS